MTLAQAQWFSAIFTTFTTLKEFVSQPLKKLFHNPFRIKSFCLLQVDFNLLPPCTKSTALPTELQRLC